MWQYRGRYWQPKGLLLLLRTGVGLGRAGLRLAGTGCALGLGLGGGGLGVGLTRFYPTRPRRFAFTFAKKCNEALKMSIKMGVSPQSRNGQRTYLDFLEGVLRSSIKVSFRVQNTRK